MKTRLALVIFAAACRGATPGGAGAPQAPPASPSPDVAALVGEYAYGGDTLTVLERDGGAWLLPWGGTESRILTDTAGRLRVEGSEISATLLRQDDGTPLLLLGGNAYRRIQLGGVGGEPFRIKPQHPVEELLTQALAASPPVETGDFREPELVELATLDPGIRLDIRYASTNNFMGEVFYSEPRAFLQRPAAEALLRAHRWLGERGYGLLIHDGYRPWYVTKMFWDATPEALREFVADPARGSRHNRGCAVDLTLYWLDTGEPVEMPGGYDEFSPRSYPGYKGGTTRQRWHRELLRQAMEAQGFSVYEAEWWHFDYKDWREYPILDIPFEQFSSAKAAGKGQ